MVYIFKQMCIELSFRWSDCKVTDLRPLPKPAPQGDILRFIFKQDGGMMAEGGRRKEQTDRQTDRFEIRAEQQQDMGREL